MSSEIVYGFCGFPKISFFLSLSQVCIGKTIWGLVTLPIHREKLTKLSAMHTHSQGWRLGYCCPEDTLIHERWLGRFYIVAEGVTVKVFPSLSVHAAIWHRVDPLFHPILAIFRSGEFVKANWVHVLWCWPLYPPWPPDLMVHSAANQFSKPETLKQRNAMTPVPFN